MLTTNAIQVRVLSPRKSDPKNIKTEFSKVQLHALDPRKEITDFQASKHVVFITCWLEGWRINGRAIRVLWFLD